MITAFIGTCMKLAFWFYGGYLIGDRLERRGIFRTLAEFAISFSATVASILLVAALFWLWKVTT